MRQKCPVFGGQRRVPLSGERILKSPTWRSCQLLIPFKMLLTNSETLLTFVRPECRCLCHCWSSDSIQQRVPAWSPWQHRARPIPNHYLFTLQTALDSCKAHNQEF